MTFSKKLVLLTLPALIALAAVSGTATAATLVGQKCATPTSGPPVIFQRTVASGTSWTIPTDGIITKWGHNRTGSTGSEMVAAVVGTVDGSQWTIVSGSFFVDAPPSVESEFAARFAVSAGQTLGSSTYNSSALMCSSGNPADLLDYGSYSPIGSTFSTSGTITGVRANIWATLEADVDKDGYGDDTQDQCPQSAAFQNPCPVLAISQQLAAAKGAIAITATASVDASLTATASVNLPKLGKKKAATVTFSSPATAFAGGQLTKLKLKLPSRVTSALAATKKSKKLKFTVTLTGNGLANTATSIKSISLPGTKK